MTSSSRCVPTPPSLFVTRRRARPKRTFRKGLRVVPGSFRVRAPFANRRFSRLSSAFALRSKMRGFSFDVAKCFRSSIRAENAREAPFSKILDIDRFRNVLVRLRRTNRSTLAIFRVPFRFRSTPGAPLGLPKRSRHAYGSLEVLAVLSLGHFALLLAFSPSEELLLSSSQTIFPFRRFLVVRNASSRSFASEARHFVSWPICRCALFRYSLSAVFLELIFSKRSPFQRVRLRFAFSRRFRHCDHEVFLSIRLLRDVLSPLPRRFQSEIVVAKGSNCRIFIVT